MAKKMIIGYWIAEKKRQKFNWPELERMCENEGIILKPVDINADIEPQGPFDVFLHKLTDILSHAENNNEEAMGIVSRFKLFVKNHPELLVIDPFENVKKLRSRYESYTIIKDGIESSDIFVPRFVLFDKPDTGKMTNLLKQHQIKFPIVCKPVIAHGSSDAHKMMIIFNERGFKDCKIPCVAQELVNHNAILYKVFVVDDKFHVVERPSFKNFYQKDCETMETIFFCSHDISNRGSQSKWSVISKDEQHLTNPVRQEMIETIVQRMRKVFGLVLVGIDIVVENHTGKYAIIDVNVFPAYEGYPNFFEHLIKAIKHLKEQKSAKSFKLMQKELSNDLDSGFESDEKKKCV